MKRTLYIVLPVTALLLVLGLWTIYPRAAYSAEIKTYFADVHGLHEGAEVDVAGVQVGKVKSIKVVPSAAPQPVEVVMSLSTTYPLDLPSDAFALVKPTGVLSGGLIVEIEIKSAHGLPIKRGAILKSVDTPEVKLSDVVKTIADAVADGKGNTPSTSEAAPKLKATPQSSPIKR